MIPHAFRVGPRRNILFSLGSALLSRPRGVGLWFLGVCKFHPLNFGAVTFPKCKLDQVASLPDILQ